MKRESAAPLKFRAVGLARTLGLDPPGAAMRVLDLLGVRVEHAVDLLAVVLVQSQIVDLGVQAKKRACELTSVTSTLSRRQPRTLWHKTSSERSTLHGFRACSRKARLVERVASTWRMRTF